MKFLCVGWGFVKPAVNESSATCWAWNCARTGLVSFFFLGINMKCRIFLSIFRSWNFQETLFFLKTLQQNSFKKWRNNSLYGRRNFHNGVVWQISVDLLKWLMLLPLLATAQQNGSSVLSTEQLFSYRENNFLIKPWQSSFFFKHNNTDSVFQYGDQTNG